MTGRTARALACAAASLALVAGCAGSSGPTGTTSSTGTSASSRPPAPVLTAAELKAWESDVSAFVERFNSNAHDAAAAFAAFTDDAALLDPGNGDYRIAPKDQLIRRWAEFVDASPGYSARTTARYLALDAAADQTEVGGAPPEMATALTGGVLHELRVFRFAQARTPTATTLELWYLLTDSENLNPETCLTRRTCGVDPRELAARYTQAWSSNDRAAIAALYSTDATLTDSLLGVQASGATAIAGLGSGVTATCTVVAIYVQTNDGDPVTSDNTDPDGGKAAGIAVVQRCGTGGSAQPTVDRVSILMLGTRPLADEPIDLDPGGRIVHEEILRNPAAIIGTSAGR